MESLDTERVRLEALKIEHEYRLREAELAIRRDELNAKIKAEQESRTTRGMSPVLATVLVAVFGLVGTGVGATLQGFFSIRLEREKFESSLISKAIEAEDEAERAKRLEFYTKIGLISNDEMAKRLQPFIKNPSTIPKVSSVVGTEFGDSIRECVGGALSAAGLPGEIGYEDKIVWGTLPDDVIVRLAAGVTSCLRREGYELPPLGTPFQLLKAENRVTSVAEIVDAIAKRTKR